MFGLGVNQAGRIQEGGPRYAERVAKLLGENLDLTPVQTPLESPVEVGGGAEEGPGDDGPWELHLIETADACRPEGVETVAAVKDKQAEAAPENRLTLEEGTKRIAEALWTLAQAPQETRQRAEKSKGRIEAALEAIGRVSTELGEVRGELAGVHAEMRSVPQRDSGMRATIAEFEDRLRRSEADLQTVRDQILEFGSHRSESHEQLLSLVSETASLSTRLSALDKTIEGLDRSIHTFSQTVDTLSSRCESLRQTHETLQARQSEQASAIEQLQADSAHTGGLMDSLVASLRGLDGRTERRHSINKEVRVVMIGAAETSIRGQVMDASDSGLGLRLPSAIPAGSPIRLDVDGTLILGEVAHCRRRGDSYAVGLKSVHQLDVPVSA